MTMNDWLLIGEDWAFDAWQRYQEGTPKRQAIREGKQEMTLNVEREGCDRWSDEWECAEDGFVDTWNALARDAPA